MAHLNLTTSILTINSNGLKHSYQQEEIMKLNRRKKSKTQPSAVYKTHNFKTQDSPAGTVVKNPPANAGDMGSIPGPGRSHMLRSN